MIRFTARILCFALGLLAASALFAQTEFSADVVNNDKRGTEHATKIYFGKDKIRFDGMGHGGRMGNGAVIMDLNAQTWTILMPEQKMYMEMPPHSAESKEMFTYFHSGDAENACPDWLKLDRNHGGTCHKVGSENVNGRSTVHYAGTDSEGKPHEVWLDSKLRFPVKWSGKDEEGGEMQNIKEGPQPASLFEIPSGYTKMDMSGMMQQRKHN